MRRAVLIYNPAAGRHAAPHLVGRIDKLLSRTGLVIDAAATSGPGDAERLARSAVEDRAWAVFACGGDGTLRECAAGMLGSDTVLGFLPAGTANVMTRVLGLPGKSLATARALTRAKIVSLDVGLCNDHPFLMQASAGLDADVLRRVKQSRKRLFGRGEIALATLSGWCFYDYPRFDVTTPAAKHDVSFAALCNIPFYAGSWRMAPEARWDDGQLDLVLLGSGGRMPTLGFARDLAAGRHTRRPDVACSRVEEATISAAPGLCLQLDGDFLPDALPARLRLAEAPVRFLVPS